MTRRALLVSAGLGRDVVHRVREKIWKVSRLGGQMVICLSNSDRTVGRRSAGGSLRGVGSWWSGEGIATLSVEVLRECSGGTHEYRRGSWTGSGSHTGGRCCT